MPDEVKLVERVARAIAAEFGRNSPSAADDLDMRWQSWVPEAEAAIEATRPTAATDDVVKELELVERIKQLRAERKRYFDVEGDSVDVLLCDIQTHFDAVTAKQWSSPKPALELP